MRTLTALPLCLTLLASSSQTFAQTAPAASAIAMQQAGGDFDKFIPKPTNNKRIDFKFWSDVLQGSVMMTGVSTRQAAPKPSPLTGTRFIWEHKSPYRREGNKIPFSRMDDNHIATLKAYRTELEDISKTVDIATLPKEEQLAYWFNLHNAVVIALIAENYPVVVPSSLKLGPQKQLFHDAKLINVNGTLLSLRDIRENIVFRNWQNPMVMYGFFYGDIGSPSIPTKAFTSENIDELLEQNADEFMNALRGFENGRISKLYKEAAPYFFPNFEKDLRTHFETYMWEDVKKELAKVKAFKVAPYEYEIADIEGGYSPRYVGPLTIDGKPVRDSQSFAMQSFVAQLREKRSVLIAQGRFKRGTVTVEFDIPGDAANPPAAPATNPPPKEEAPKS
jgi:hypothetical protein